MVASKEQYKWNPKDGKIESVYSDKTVVELGKNDNIKNQNVQSKVIETSFEFWTKKLYMNVSQLDNEKIIMTENFYEFQGQGNLKNVDVTDWATDELVTFRVGMHLSREARDWMIVQFKYPGKGVASTIDSFTCIDGYSSVGHHDTWDKATISYDQYQNCEITEGESKIEEEEVDGDDGTKRTIASITVHMTRPFNSVYPDSEDIAIVEGEPLGLQLMIEWKDNERLTGTTIIAEDPAASWEKRKGSGQHLVVSILIILLNAIYFL